MKSSRWRFIYMALAGIVISMLLHSLQRINLKDHNPVLDFISSICITILVWEGNLHIDHWMNRKFPWVTKPGKRVLVHLPVSMLFSASVIFIGMKLFSYYICDVPEATKQSFMFIALVIGLLVTLIILSIEISVQFFKSWKSSVTEVEKYRNESLQAQLQNLKNQLNPHFLFNNMSVLSSLIYKDQDKAVDFVNQLSKVYRYLLDNRNNELVSLETELGFIRSYTYLLQIRFDKNIVFELDIPDNLLQRQIPPMALQMLLENAIKHNEISEASPLVIRIRAGDSGLEVSNAIKLRTNREESSNTGLKNIAGRYRYFTDETVHIDQHNQVFTVRIPLLPAK
ncbi:MAG: sensor histidine kinase [Bacteroidia bacterium]